MPANAAEPMPGSQCDRIGMPGTRRTDAGVRAYLFARGGGGCPAPYEDRRLAPGSKLSSSGITCAVTPGGVACTDPIMNHGFVLSSAGSWAF